MNSNQMEDWPPIIRFHPGKLTDLAAVSFVAAILHNKVLHMRQYGWQKFYDNALDLAQVSIPNALRRTIDRLINKMETNRTEWWTYHARCVFLYQFSADDMIDWLDKLIWLNDGTIDYRKTVIEMLNYEKVPNVRKFQLACSYCLINEVELWKKTLTEEELNKATKNYRESDDEILNYWGAVVSDEWCKNVIVLRDPAAFIDSVMGSLEYYDEGSAIEYFFDQLKNENRLLKIQSILDLDKPRLIWLLLPKLTGPELDFIIENKSLEIMNALVKNPRFFEYTISIWKRMVNLIDDETLVKIIHRINCLAPATYERSYMNPLLWEIWLATSERQKKVLADQRTCDFTEKLNHIYHEYYYSPNFPLILDVLSRFVPERRYEYFSKHWLYLVVGQMNYRNFIDRIMKLCFSNDQQIETFKNTVMIDYNSIKKSCEYLIMYGRAKDISTYLEFCSSDQRKIRDLKKKIMTGAPKSDIFHFLFEYSNSESLADFYHYLDDIFTKQESEEFLNNVITNSYNLKKMRLMVPNKFQRVVRFVEKFVSSNQVLAKVKHNFFENCRRQNFESRSVFLDLMAWCFNLNKDLIEQNEALIEEFKKLPPSEYEESNITMDEFDSPIHITFLEPYAKLIGDENTMITIRSLKY